VTLTLTVLAMGAVTYALRLLGFALPAGRLAPFWVRLLRFVPITVFAALIATSVPGRDGQDTVARTVCLGLAAMVLLRRAPLWLALLVGLLPYLVWRVAAP
jgi:branched-subunit amino acid transport protein